MNIKPEADISNHDQSMVMTPKLKEPLQKLENMTRTLDVIDIKPGADISNHDQSMVMTPRLKELLQKLENMTRTLDVIDQRLTARGLIAPPVIDATDAPTVVLDEYEEEI